MRSTKGVTFAPLVASLLCALAWSSPAHAKFAFGTKEYLNSIQDVDIKGPNGEALYLGYKYSFYSFILPYTMSDDGYILGVKGRDAYVPLDKAGIDKFQAAGLLPSPLPAYELSVVDYVMGHIIWAVPLFVAGAAVIKRTRPQNR
jgi:hypothetical protein